MDDDLTALQSDQKALETASRELQQQRDRIQSIRSEIEKQRKSLETEQASVVEEKAQLQSQHTDLEQEQQRVQEVNEKLDLERQELQQTLEQTSVDQQAMQAEREQLRKDRGQIQQELERLQTQKASLLEEKAGLARKQAEYSRQMSQVVATPKESAASRSKAGRNQAADGKARGKKKSRGKQQPASAVVAIQWKELLATVEQERRQLAAERARLQDELSMLHSSANRQSAISRTSATDTDSRVLSDDSKLESMQRIIVEVGSASSLQLDDLLQNLSQVYERMGGGGIRFDVRNARVWHADKEGAGSSEGTEAERTFVELYATPRTSDHASRNDDGSEHWEQFLSCLQMSFPVDAGLSDYFEIGEAVASTHRVRQIVVDAAHSTDASPSDADGQSLSGSGLRIDDINSQLQDIADIRSRLEREHGLTMELATERVSNPNSEEPNAASRADRPRWSRLRKMLLAAGVLAAFALATYSMGVNWVGFTMTRPTDAALEKEQPAGGHSASAKG